MSLGPPLLAAAALSTTQIVCMAVFLLAFLTIVYVLFGYPLLLDWISRRHDHPIHKDDQLRSVSIILPVRNGAQFMARKLESLLLLNYPRELMEIIVVSDDSDDGTDDIARQFAPRGVRLLRVARGGKSAAINQGVPLTSGDILVFTDVRQVVDPEALRNLVACFGDPKVGAVSGQLSIVDEQSHEEANTSLYWKYELWLRTRMCRIDSSFGTTGAFYGLRRALWQAFPPGVLLDDAYLPLKAAFFRGYRVIYEPTARMFDFPTALDSEFRRKVRTQAGLYQLLEVMPELLSSRNRMRLHFLSGKYGRTLVPHCLILMVLSTFGLPPGLRMFAALGQLAFYFAAVLDPLVPSKFFLKKITSPIRTFVVLMTAAFLALRVFFVSPTSLWKETKVRHTTA
jgi:cellulose synthase/poly-beta-1,6-N-acetylglucosamine synthase-like glycosyltransferase